MNKKFVVAVTGASGMVYARRLLDVLQDKAEVHLIISDIAHRIAKLGWIFPVLTLSMRIMTICSPILQVDHSGMTGW